VDTEDNSKGVNNNGCMYMCVHVYVYVFICARRHRSETSVCCSVLQCVAEVKLHVDSEDNSKGVNNNGCLYMCVHVYVYVFIYVCRHGSGARAYGD